MTWWVVGAAVAGFFMSAVLANWADGEDVSTPQALTNGLLAAIAVLLWFIAR